MRKHEEKIKEDKKEWGKQSLVQQQCKKWNRIWLEPKQYTQNHTKWFSTCIFYDHFYLSEKLTFLNFECGWIMTCGENYETVFPCIFLMYVGNKFVQFFHYCWYVQLYEIDFEGSIMSFVCSLICNYFCWRK